MAKATTKVRTIDNLAVAKQEDELDHLQELLADHGEDVAVLLKLAELLREKGLLDAAIAGLEQGQDIMGILVSQANRPGSLSGIKSLIAIVQGISKVDSRLVSAVFGGLGEASSVIAGGEADPVSGLWDIVRVIRDPDVTVGLTAIFAILKSIGRHLDAKGTKASPSAQDAADAADAAL